MKKLAAALALTFVMTPAMAEDAPMVVNIKRLSMETTEKMARAAIEACRKEGINQNLYYRWSKEFLEAGKKRLAGDTAREANSDEVKTLRDEAAQLKEALAETLLENRLLKKSSYGAGGDDT